MVPNFERTSQFDKSKKEKTAVSPPVPKYVLPIPQKIHWVQDTGVLVVQKLRQITNQSSSASVRLLHALFNEKEFPWAVTHSVPGELELLFRGVRRLPLAE